MAKEYIDREKYCVEFCRYNNNTCDRAQCPVWRMPAADVDPVVHGRWKKEGGDINYAGSTVFCSYCGKRHFVFGKHYFSYSCPELCTEPDYCPHCGARMEVGAEDG